ncbi:MAG: hypothetical protein GC184_10330 [Rhizobiales bacterium]|nr:hypothetical protein [Hyphomicrobiales bacterium]
MSLIASLRRFLGLERQHHSSFYDSQQVMKDAVDRVYLDNIIDFTLFSDEELSVLGASDHSNSYRNKCFAKAARRELHARMRERQAREEAEAQAFEGSRLQPG